MKEIRLLSSSVADKNYKHRNKIILNDDDQRFDRQLVKNNNQMQKSHSILFDDRNNLSTFYTHKNSHNM